MGIPDSYTTESSTCSLCKYAVAYHHGYTSMLCCCHDGTKHPTVDSMNRIIPAYSLYEDELSKADEWEKHHEVESHGTCKKFTKADLPHRIFKDL